MWQKLTAVSLDMAQFFGQRQGTAADDSTPHFDVRVLDYTHFHRLTSAQDYTLEVQTWLYRLNTDQYFRTASNAWTSV